MTLPPAQIDGGDPVEERGAKQTNGGIEKPGDFEELGGDHGIGLTRGQHQIHESPRHAHRWRPSPFDLRNCQVIGGSDLPVLIRIMFEKLKRPFDIASWGS